ncbi:MAG: endonuclease/exonuclease/phosphatase family protein [Pseudomonadota bacterium]
MVRSAKLISVLSFMFLVSLSSRAEQETLRVATFNVSIEAGNYLDRSTLADDPSRASIVSDFLSSGNNQQIRNIAEIIQRTRPDILLLNEFDYIPDSDQGIGLLIKNYLAVSQNGQEAIDYPYYYVAPVNTGVATPFDLDNNGSKSGIAGDAYGFGFYPGQYGMALLSRFPIQVEQTRTLKNFLWKDMPGALVPRNEDGTPWYSDEEWGEFRLSSKSHWDVPIKTDAGIVHIIAAHPTPPTFDGAEDRNGKRNHDEIRLIKDYISNQPYIYTDDGQSGGIKEDTRFVIVGDLNSSSFEGDSIKSSIQNLLEHQLVDASCSPASSAAQQLRPDNQYAAQHTAAWGLRVDYTLPSKHGFTVKQCGVFWPAKNDPLFRLIANRQSSSDHRLVWVDLILR